MKPAPLNLTIYRGITFSLVLILRDASGTPINLTDYLVFADARQKPDQAIAFSLSPTLTNAAAGEITIAKTDEETAQLTTGIFAWDLVLQNSTGERLGPFLAGNANVLPLNTQP